MHWLPLHILLQSLILFNPQQPCEHGEFKFVVQPSWILDGSLWPHKHSFRAYAFHRYYWLAAKLFLQFVRRIPDKAAFWLWLRPR